VNALAREEIKVPNIGDVTNVEVIEVLVSVGDQIKKDDSIITLESDKASMEIPTTAAGTVTNIQVKVGDRVSEGSLILQLETQQEQQAEQPASEEKKPERPAEVPVKAKEAAKEKEEVPVIQSPLPAEVSAGIHASPAVRRLAHELGVDMAKVNATGPKGRILKEDVQTFVKSALQYSGGFVGEAISVSKAPEIDFSKFGEIERVPLNKIKKLTGANVHRSWVTVPHVTQFGSADITDMEQFRKAQQSKLEKEGIKLTPLVFIMKAVIAALKRYPHFNASLDTNAENLILKKYYNLGIAVDTPNGLVVPVIKDVAAKGMLAMARELAEISKKAREKGLTPAEMSGSCFTISSLGGIGGTAFTPIINAPDVAILGVSKASIQPQYEKNQFVPRLMLPLSLSYDHRVIDGADGARFLVYLADCLSDLRSLLL
jgi:pyruvate dehydrogenase E2 component (dihydrolipoamide acetyltransferase)